MVKNEGFDNIQIFDSNKKALPFKIMLFIQAGSFNN